MSSQPSENRRVKKQRAVSPDQILECCTPHRIVTPFVERYARIFEPRNLPKPLRRGRLGACFANSYHMAIRHGVTYVEGYAVTQWGRAHLHAWCIDGGGTVFDRTWDDALAYFGIPFRTSFLKKTIWERRLAGDLYYGLLDDWTAGFPLITAAADSPGIWLAE